MGACFHLPSATCDNCRPAWFWHPQVHAPTITLTSPANLPTPGAVSVEMSRSGMSEGGPLVCSHGIPLRDLCEPCLLGRGALEERARIVSHLDARSAHANGDVLTALRKAASAIERGEHVPGPKPAAPRHRPLTSREQRTARPQ